MEKTAGAEVQPRPLNEIDKVALEEEKKKAERRGGLVQKRSKPPEGLFVFGRSV